MPTEGRVKLIVLARFARADLVCAAYKQWLTPKLKNLHRQIVWYLTCAKTARDSVNKRSSKRKPIQRHGDTLRGTKACTDFCRAFYQGIHSHARGTNCSVDAKSLEGLGACKLIV
jgi:hypothetical protein